MLCLTGFPLGGGSAGCNALYQLSKRGVKAVLLERSKLTAGTTWHTAGLIWRLRPNDVEIQLLRSTRDLLTKLESETGLDPGWINNGGLYLANNKERLNEYSRLATVGHSFGIDSTIVSPEEAKKLFPLLDENVIHGGLYCPGDGVVDPAMLCTALTRSASKSGGQVIENCPVQNILTGKNGFGSKKVTGVTTSYGVIKTNCVANCSGSGKGKADFPSDFADKSPNEAAGYSTIAEHILKFEEIKSLPRGVKIRRLDEEMD
uniref:FAD dependent oxidoreductase domain-containing protein n=1 Tax=Timema bartmani TaxID=61472 RepID=A0A7R9F903_9NEOP|nr:unnamed protein product [Timema bartmani]